MVLTINLIDWDGKALLRTLQVEPADTVQELKETIEKELGIPKWSQILYVINEDSMIEISSVGLCGVLGDEGYPIEVTVQRRDEATALVLQEMWETCKIDSAVPRWYREQEEATRGEAAIAMEVLLRAGECLKDMSEELKDNDTVVLQAVQKDGMALEFASSNMKKVRQVVMTAVCQKGMALQFADDRWKDSPSIVKAAMTNDRRAKEFAKVDPKHKDAAEPVPNQEPDQVFQVMGLMGYHCTLSAELKTPLGELKEMIEKETSIPKWEQKLLFLGREVRTADEFKNVDKNFPIILMLVNRNEDVAEKLKELEACPGGSSVVNWLGKQSEDYQSNYDVVMEAVARTGEALKHAAKELKRNKDVVMVALKTYGSALAFASLDLQKDKEVVLAAVMHTGGALEYASADLKQDKQVVLAAIRQDTAAIQFAPMAVQQDPDIQRAVGGQDQGCVRACGCVIS